MDRPDSTGPSANAKKPPRKRRRLWISLLVVLVLSVWLGRAAYLRVTLKPTPRPEFWEGELLSDSIPPPARSVLDALSNRPFEKTFPLTLFPNFNTWSLFTPPQWSRIPLELAVRAVLPSNGFEQARKKVQRV